MRSLFFSLFLFSSCGYHVGQGTLSSKYSTITIPYVRGDEYGEFTNALVREISRSGNLSYKRGHADLSLNVSIIDYTYENIGFRYDRKSDEKLTDSIIPTETRVQAIVEVFVTECSSGCILLGPVQIKTFLDFDHDYYNSRNDINEKSLGQLTDYDAAIDGTSKPLFDSMARKVADFVYDSW